MSIVVIPAYQPDKTFISLVEQLYESRIGIVVVDDGSGMEYQEIFQKVEDIAVVLQHRENRGKGAAIKTALSYITETCHDREMIGIMDCDGQHQTGDMIRLFEEAEFDPNALILGVRHVGTEMPLKSRVGNKVTRAVFTMMTGVHVSDTQTGMRVFGPELARFFETVRGERYEYEMNVLMEAAKRGIPIREVPIKTIYHDAENSCSHFRALHDSVRICWGILGFTLSSLSSFILDYLLFCIMIFFLPHTSLCIMGANITARIVSAAYNYTINCRYVFHEEQKLNTAVGYFFLAAAILLMNNFVLSALIYKLKVPVYAAKPITECILFLVSWTVQTLVIFQRKEMSEDRLSHKGAHV